MWEPTGDGKRVVSLADNHLLLWDLQESASRARVGDDRAPALSWWVRTWGESLTGRDARLGSCAHDSDIVMKRPANGLDYRPEP